MPVVQITFNLDDEEMLRKAIADADIIFAHQGTSGGPMLFGQGQVRVQLEKGDSQDNHVLMVKFKTNDEFLKLSELVREIKGYTDQMEQLGNRGR